MGRGRRPRRRRPGESGKLDTAGPRQAEGARGTSTWWDSSHFPAEVRPGAANLPRTALLRHRRVCLLPEPVMIVSLRALSG